jgi:hypothetical protein
MTRAGLKAFCGLWTLVASIGPTGAQEPKPARAPVEAETRPGGTSEQARVREAVARLVEQLRLHPAKPSGAPDRLALHLIDLETREVTLIADEPDAGLVRIGSTCWSHDGRRIVFDAMPMNRAADARLKVIELDGRRLAVNDLGPGNCPSFSPDDSRIVFLLNTAPQTGVWLMQADGSNRRFLGTYGRPLWSPDSHQFMIVDFGRPRTITLMDIDPEKSGPLEFPGKDIFWEPSWAGPGMIAASIGTEAPDAIALIEVGGPGHHRIKELLWQKAEGPDVKPYYPLYSPSTGRCVFVGISPKGQAFYTFRRRQVDPPARLEALADERIIQDTAMSPDGRYVLFCSSRTPNRRAGAVGADGPGKRGEAHPPRSPDH